MSSGCTDFRGRDAAYPLYARFLQLKCDLPPGCTAFKAGADPDGVQTFPDELSTSYFFDG